MFNPCEVDTSSREPQVWNSADRRYDHLLMDFCVPWAIYPPENTDGFPKSFFDLRWLTLCLCPCPSFWRRGWFETSFQSLMVQPFMVQPFWTSQHLWIVWFSHFGCFEAIFRHTFGYQALFLSPTRELAEQSQKAPNAEHHRPFGKPGLKLRNCRNVFEIMFCLKIVSNS